MQYLGLEDMEDIPSGYDTYVWMHERCFHGIEWSKEHNVNYAIIPYNWKTDEEIRGCNHYLNDVKKIVLDYAAAILNEYHQTSYDTDTWNIMLGRWMTGYLMSFYDKYLKLRKLESSGERYECALYDTTEAVIALDYMDYSTLNSSDEFHLYQYSELYREQYHFTNIKARQIKRYERPPIEYREKTLGYYVKLIYGAFIRSIKILTRLQDDVVFETCYYLPFDLLLEVMKKKPGRITNYIHDFIRTERKKINTEVDYNWRNKESFLPDIEDEFAVMMCKLLKRSLPIAYVEAFPFLQKRAKKLYKFAKNPKAVFYSDNGISYNEVFKAYLMTIKQTGTLFCDIQHGGNYGIERFLDTQVEYEICDYFYTWGWQIEKNFPTQCRPMPAAKLLDKRLQHMETGDDILYVSYTPFKSGNILYKRFLLYDEERKSEIKFLRGLSNPLRQKLLVRLFPEDRRWHVRENIDCQVSGIRYDEEKEFYNSLKKVNLVVLMLWSTTILEALYAGKPILVLHDTCHAEDAALEDIRELERVGILVRTWEKLGLRLEEIYQNVNEWWNEPERQKVVKKIRDKYMYMPKNSREIWTDEILSLADGNHSRRRGTGKEKEYAES